MKTLGAEIESVEPWKVTLTCHDDVGRIDNRGLTSCLSGSRETRHDKSRGDGDRQGGISGGLRSCRCNLSSRWAG